MHRWHLLIPIGFLCAVFLVFGRALHHEFINLDDTSLIVNNELTHGLSLEHVRQAFTTYDPELYIPLTLLSYQAEYSLAGLSSFLIHLNNIFLHVINALLVSWILFLLIDHLWIATFLGLLFALHPQNVETVVWASARKDLLSAFFCLASYALFLGSRKVSRSQKPLRISLLLFFFGLLSKVNIALLPCTFVLHDWYKNRTFSKKYFSTMVPFGLLSIFFIAIAFAGKSAALGGTTMLQKMLIAPLTIWLTVLKFFIPVHLSLLYPYTKTISFLNPEIYVSAGFLAIISFITLLSLQRTKAYAFGFGVFLLLLAPSLVNIERGVDVYFASDRYAYLPSLGLLFIVASFLKKFLSAQKSVRAFFLQCLLLAILGVFAWNAHAQVRVWQNNKTMYTSVLSLYPNAYAASSNLGLDALDRGKASEALIAFSAAHLIHPTLDTSINLGIALQAAGRTDDALLQFRQITMQHPESVDAHHGIANALNAKKQYQEAIEEYRKTLAIDPEFIPAHNNLGSLLMTLKLWSGAILEFEKAASLHAKNGDVYFNLGISYENVGRRSDAVSAFQEALRLNPNDLQSAQILQSLLFQ